MLLSDTSTVTTLVDKRVKEEILVEGEEVKDEHLVLVTKYHTEMRTP